jgi:hypothetical protein
MYKSVYELNTDQLDELKTSYFYSDEYDPNITNNAGLPVLFPGDIPNDVIFNIYKRISFADDDFFSKGV